MNNLLKYLAYSLSIYLLCWSTDLKACHLASVTITSGPNCLGGGTYGFTIKICTGSGASSMGLLCGTGGIGNTEDYTITATGASINSTGFTGSLTSGFNGVVSTGSVMSG